ncbi:MAG TPA: hypothetical protein VN750_12445 [Steroidobacteraceae bacterium]|nr:hypothetical protein [Steroidobacteraceae bacterium]
MAYEVVRLDAVTTHELAMDLVADAYHVDIRTVERAVKAHRAEAEQHLPAYLAELGRLGKLPTGNSPK